MEKEKKTTEYFRLMVKVVCGRGLPAKDANGKSDPYALLICGDNMCKTTVKNHTCNPDWNEQFDVNLQKKETNINFKVFDFDILSSDDFIGEANISLKDLKLDELRELKLELSSKDKDVGYIVVRIILQEVSREEKLKEKLINTIRNNNSSYKDEHKCDGVIWLSFIQVKLLGSQYGEDNKCVCNITLGKEEIRHIKVQANTNPSKIEPLYLEWFEKLDDFVEISLLNNNEAITKNKRVGRTFINLKGLAQEETLNLWLPLQDCETAGELNVLVTITATERTTSSQNHLYHAGDVGHLLVKVIEADGLQSKSCGRRQPFVMLKLVNQCVQTRQKEGTESVVWEKEFNFHVIDIHTELEVIVYDGSETPPQFLGKVVIPLTHIQSGLVRRWYRLKDKSLKKAAKGEDSKILLEITLSYNFLKAASKMILPREVKFESKPTSKLKMSTLNLHLTRLRAVQARLTPPAKIVQKIENILSWKSPAETGGVMSGTMLGIWCFEVWMIPAGLMIPFLHNLMRPSGRNILETETSLDDEEEEQSGNTFSDVAALQQKALLMQQYLGCTAHVAESFENVFNFSDPIVSWLLLGILMVSVVALFVVPLRIILIFLTIRLFSKRLYDPLPANKLYNFMSRLQDKQQMRDYEELTAE